MKKILKAVLVFLVAFLVVGCQQANQNGSTQEGKNDSGSVETAENEKEATGQDDPLRIALVVVRKETIPSMMRLLVVSEK